MKRAVINWTVVILFSALLLAGSLIPAAALGAELRNLIEGRDIIMHGIGHGILGLLACRALSAKGRTRALMWGVLFAVGYGAFLELLQGLLSARTCSIFDAGANVVGAGSGGLLWLGFITRSKLIMPKAGKREVLDD